MLDAGDDALSRGTLPQGRDALTEGRREARNVDEVGAGRDVLLVGAVDVRGRQNGQARVRVLAGDRRVGAVRVGRGLAHGVTPFLANAMDGVRRRAG